MTNRPRSEHFPHWLNSLMGDDEHAYFYVCTQHAKQYALETDDSCVNGNVCCVEGCERETSLLHYLWDFRFEIVEDRIRTGRLRPNG